jgi:ribosomal protein S18 acetylase RimI-like enzyme
MTAQVDYLTQRQQLVDICHLTGRDLDPLLLEAAAEWDLELYADFSRFAGLVRRLADLRRLNGAALLEGGEVAGYGCTGFEDHKGLITDVYVRPRWRSGNGEAMLVRALFDGLAGTPGVRRVEGQLMLVAAASAKALQQERTVHLFERLLMKLDAKILLAPGPAAGQRFRIDPWDGRHHDAAAAVISLAHRGHTDWQINDEYRTIAGASRLLSNIVQFPGFHPSASYIVFDAATQSAAGIVLSTLLADDSAQITELCVTPQATGAGLGYELLRQSIATLREAGAKRISLSVTAANENAVRLYTRCGFRTARQYYACVWEREA